jgi:hypothetical protein
MADEWGQFIDRVKGDDEGQPKKKRKPKPKPAPGAGDPAARRDPEARKPAARKPSAAHKKPGARTSSAAHKKPGARKPSAAHKKPGARTSSAAQQRPTARKPSAAQQRPAASSAPQKAATSRIREEINQKARIVPVDKIQKGGAKFVRVINPSTLSEIVGKAVVAVLEGRGAGVAEQERAEIQAQARKQFMDLLGEHQRVLAEKNKTDAERAKLEMARQKAVAEKEAADQQRAEVERERTRALAEANEQRAELEQERLKALAQAREQREELEREREAAAKEREELERERAEALAGKSEAEQQRGQLAGQMSALRAEIEASHRALAEERQRAEEEATETVVLSQDSVQDVEYRVQALLDRMLRDGELSPGKPGQHAGLEDFKRELSDTVGRVLSAARKDAGSGRSEAIELLERRIAKLHRALVDREEAMETLDEGQDLHPRFREDPLKSIRTEEVTARSTALVGAGIDLPGLEFGIVLESEAEPEPETEAESESETEAEPESESESRTQAEAGSSAHLQPDPDHVPPWMRETEPAPPAAQAPDYRPAAFLSEPEPGFSRLVTPGSWPFLWRCGAMRMVFLDTLEVEGIDPTEGEVSGAFPASSRLFGGVKVDPDDDPTTWNWPLHGS